jgi:DNA polymerase III subunit gamma/tau
MAYQVLARKWRPKTFDEVVGQGTVTRTLQNALASGRIGHAFLLSGARGVGKTTSARILAKALNCSRDDKPTAEPCGVCASCVEITNGSSLDVQEIDGATHNGVEQVRELRESARYNPARDRFKIWIIDEVHMLSTGAFNALLKTLEEPPPRVKFVFATTEYHKIPDTILSRCQQYDFRLIPARELVTHLRQVADGEGIKVSDDTLARLARTAEGSARDALSLFDQVLSFSGQTVRDEDVSALLGLIDRELLLAASRAVAAGDSLAALELVERLSDYGADYRNFTRELILHFRELLLLKVAPGESVLVAQIVPEERERLQPVAAALSEEDLLRIFEVLAKAETDLRLAQDPRVTLEMALLKIVQMQRLLPFADLVARVERLAGGVSAPAPAPRAPEIAAAPRPSPRPEPAPAAAPVPVPRAAEARTPPPIMSATLPGVPAPPPPAPAPTAPAPAASAPTTATLADGPDAVLQAMVSHAQARPSLSQPLRAARARQEGETLVLEFTPDFSVFADLHADEYRELARKAAGRPLKVKITSAAAESPAAVAGEPEAASPERKRQRLIEEASREPAVQEALDLFGGRVVDVRETKG